MPGFLLDADATLLCSHGGHAHATILNPRVTVSGMPTVTLASSYVVGGCPLPPPPEANGPCVAARFITSALRVKSGGQPLLLADSRALCAPTGTPLVIVATQTRVTGA